MSNIEFEEDKAYYSRIKRRDEVPDKGLEGYVYKKLPGKYSYKKAMLIIFILLLFIGSFVFFILGLYNVSSEDQSFQERVNSTRINR